MPTSWPSRASRCRWQRLWPNIPLECLNREISCRTGVVGILPHRPAALRLVGAVLAGQQDEWAGARRYLIIPCSIGNGHHQAPERWKRVPDIK